MLPVRDFAFIILVICGAILIIGALILLGKGIIHLEGTSSRGEALGIRVRNLSIRTYYPSLALFIIGALSILAAIVLTTPSTDEQFVVTGRIEGVPGAASNSSLMVLSRTIDAPTYDGAFQITVRAKPREWRLQVSSPGYSNRADVPINLPDGKLDGRSIPVGDLKLEMLLGPPSVLEPPKPQINALESPDAPSAFLRTTDWKE
jgi:hypothetical protein